MYTLVCFVFCLIVLCKTNNNETDRSSCRSTFFTWKDSHNNFYIKWYKSNKVVKQLIKNIIIIIKIINACIDINKIKLSVANYKIQFFVRLVIYIFRYLKWISLVRCIHTARQDEFLSISSNDTAIFTVGIVTITSIISY